MFDCQSSYGSQSTCRTHIRLWKLSLLFQENVTWRQISIIQMNIIIFHSYSEKSVDYQEQLSGRNVVLFVLELQE